MTDVLERLTTALADRYRIERELGRGGMAIVYLAHDLKHDRQVAVKVVQPELAAVIGAERFLNEIKVTANLQHPHILPLFDSGEADGFLFYVMPYVEGETLRQLLEREHEMAVDTAVEITRQVASALDYAYRHDVIHRDIKPENILLHDSQAVVADFGIALAVRNAGGSRLTETGLSLGTPQYMSPEQAMADRELDARSDVYSLGCVAYEMLAGETPHSGPNAQAILTKIVTEDAPPITSKRRSVPAGIAGAIHKAIQRLPADRFASAADFADALETPSATRPLGVGRAPRPLLVAWLRDRRTQLLAAASLTVLVAVAVWPRAQSTDSAPMTRRAVIPLDNAFGVAVSADGTMLVVSDGLSSLSARRLDELEWRALPNVENGNRPFLSPDGSRVGVLRGGDIVVQSITSGESLVFSGINLPRRGAAFLDNDRLLLVDSTGLVVFHMADERREMLVPNVPGMRYREPHVVPGGGRVVFTARHDEVGDATALLVTIATKEVDTLIQGALSAQAADGWLFFSGANGALQAIRFNPEEKQPAGPVIPVGDVVVVSRLGTAAFAVGRGVLLYGQRPQNRIVVLSADGRRRPLTEPGLYHAPHISPDGRRVVFDQNLGGSGGRDVWILDIAAQNISRVTSVGDGHDPVWTPDGRRVSYLSVVGGDTPLYTVSATGAPGRQVISVPGVINPGAWLPDGRGYVSGLTGEGDISDVVILYPDDTPPDTIQSSPYNEHSPAMSPDARLIAYTSDETGMRQVYVRSLSDPNRTLVSVASGVEPVWNRDGTELFYVEYQDDRSRLLAARIEPGDPPRISSRRVVLENFAFTPAGNHANWDVMPDGSFLIVEAVPGNNTVTLVFNWAPPADRP